LQTPPFPEYTCGHCTIFAACAEALTSVFGDNFAYTDTSETEFGIKSRSYASFRDAAIEMKMQDFLVGYTFIIVAFSAMIWEEKWDILWWIDFR